MTEHTEILYIIPSVSAFHIEDGVEASLNPTGPQSLQLSRVEGPDRNGEWDVFLELDLPPELSLKLPATTKIFPQRPRSYLIAPGKDAAERGGAFIRLEFPQLGRGIVQDDIDTFESILAAYTSFMERSRPPAGSGYANEKAGFDKGSGGKREGRDVPPAYNPQDFKPGEAYAFGTATGDSGAHGQVLLINQDNGSVVGELSEDSAMVDDSAIKPGEKGASRSNMPQTRIFN
jgi:spartin